MARLRTPFETNVAPAVLMARIASGLFPNVVDRPTGQAPSAAGRLRQAWSPVLDILAHGFGRVADVARGNEPLTAIEREAAAKRAFRQRWGIAYDDWRRSQQ